MLLHNIVILKWGEGKIEVKKDFMDTTLGVEKIKPFHVIRDGFDDQVAIRREVDCGSFGGVVAVKLINKITAVFWLLPSYTERKLNMGSPMSAHSCAVFIACLCFKKDGSEEEDEEGEGMHSLAMRKTL